jgi:hypothetical protein
MKIVPAGRQRARLHLLRWPLAALLTAALLATPALPAGAQSTHTYAVAYDVSEGTNYTGLIVYRYDNPDWQISPSPDGICEQFEITPIAYQTEWVIFSSGDWVEIGTGHRCNGFRYWYWGYALNGVWHRLGTRTGLTTTARDFRLWRRPPNYWDWWIENTRMSRLWYDVPPVGDQVAAGVESYDAFAVIPESAFANLRYSVRDGAFVYWSGRDAQRRDTGMCGRWTSDTRWLGGEHCTTAATGVTRATAAAVPAEEPGGAPAPQTPTAAGPATSAALATTYAGNLGTGARLVREIHTSAAAVARWEKICNGPGGPVATSDWDSRPATQPVSLYLFNGDFVNRHAPPGSSASQARWALVSVTSTGPPQIEYLGVGLPAVPMPAPR